MKIRALFLFASLFAGCSDLGTPESALTPSPSLAIQTDQQAYPTTSGSTVNVTFRNSLGRDVRIVLTDFGYPDYMLQRKFPDRWRDADAAIRLGLPTDSISLPNSSGIQRPIPLHPERIDAPFRVGTYRFKFIIVERATNQLVADEFCLSNEFQLIDQ